MSAGKIDRLLHLLAAAYPDKPPPFADHTELYSIIDSITDGDIPWESFSVSFNGALPEAGPIPPWMEEKYEVWFRDTLAVAEQQIGNPDFDKEMDYAPKRVSHKGKRRYKDFMSGNWAWEQAVRLKACITFYVLKLMARVRIRLQLTRIRTVPCWLLSFSAVTKRRFQLRLARTTFILYIWRLVIHIIQHAVPIAMRSP